MAFVMTPREGQQAQIASDSPHTPSNPEMSRDKDAKPHLDILIDSPSIILKGVGVDVEPALLTGHVAIYLTESTSIREITLHFRGKARLPALDPLTRSNAPLTYIVCTYDWSFLEGEKHRSHTLKAGRHLFPFQLRIGGSLPSSMSTPVLGGASIVYKLRAEAVRSGFSQNLHASLSVPIIRMLASEALEYQQSLEIENTWPDKLMYSIMIPHKAWAAGDKLTAVVKFAPLSKGICILNVTCTIHEQTKVHVRLGVQEYTRVVAAARFEIAGGKAKQVNTVSRSGRSHAVGHTPPTPPSPVAESPHSQQNGGSSSSGIGRPHPSPSTPLTTLPDLTASETEPSSLTFSDANDDADSSDVVAHLEIGIPTAITPSHGLDPITISHRIRWTILILNRDGHTSELRCSLPLHLLDHCFLDEARAYTVDTRRLLLGEAEESVEPEEVQLPSYMAHVRDRVANMFLPEASTVRVRNPWIAQGVSPTYGADCIIGHGSRSGHSTPLEAHPFSHLPHAPEPDSTSPLDWVDSELLLSLSQDRPVHSDPHSTGPPSDPSSRVPSRPSSRNRGLSRFSSRSASPDHERELHALTQISAASSDEIYVHTGNASRRLHSIFSASMKPFTSFTTHWMHHLTPSSNHSSASDAQRTASLRSSSSSMSPGPDPHSGPALLHRAFTEVPDYSIASRGFLGGVPPLSSMTGLPSYEETQREQ